MSNFIFNLVYRLTHLFVRRKQIEEPAAKSVTPCRVPPQANSRSRTNSAIAHSQRQKGCHTPIPKQRLPESQEVSRRPPRSCPIVKCPSQVSLRRFRSDEEISNKLNNVKRDWPFNNLQNKNRMPINCSTEDLADSNMIMNTDATREFAPMRGREQMFKTSDYFEARDRLDAMDDSPAESYENGSSDSRQFCLKNNEFTHAAFSNKNSVSSKISLCHLNKYATRQNSDLMKCPPPQRLGRDHSPDLDEKNNVLKAFSNKNSASSKISLCPLSKYATRQNSEFMKYPPPSRLGNHSPDLDEKNSFQAFSNKTSASSKIPVSHLKKHATRQNSDFMKFPAHLRWVENSHRTDDMDVFQGGGDTGGAENNMRFRSSKINNWIAYRNDTSVQFDREFKMFSKKRHTIGNLIDSTAHVQWLKLSGVEADRDASMFKHFAGGKVVLTIGEYKFLLNKICSIYDLDYWDILRKMATFREQSEALT